MKSPDERDLELFVYTEQLKAKHKDLPDQLQKSEALYSKLEDAYSEWSERRPKGYVNPDGYANLDAALYEAAAAAFSPNENALADYERRKKQEYEITLTITAEEAIWLQKALREKQKSDIGKAHVKDAASKINKDRNIWVTYAELLGAKPLDKNLATFDEDDECIAYLAAYEKHKDTHLASMEVFKQYPHKNLSACKKWIFENVGKRRNEVQLFRDLGIDSPHSVFYGIPLPSKSDAYDNEEN